VINVVQSQLLPIILDVPLLHVMYPRQSTTKRPSGHVPVEELVSMEQTGVRVVLCHLWDLGGPVGILMIVCDVEGVAMG
jgi:hypothetical protein